MKFSSSISQACPKTPGAQIGSKAMRRSALFGALNVLSSTCLAYRRSAQLLKLFTVSLSFAFINSSIYADSQLSKVGQVWRLKGPTGTQPAVRVERVKKSLSACGAETLDLILKLPSEALAMKWAELEELNQGLCDVRAYPTSDAFEMRLSYKALGRKNIATTIYETKNAWVIDHWFEYKSPKGQRKAKASKAKVKQSTSLRAANPLVDLDDELVDLYEDKESWKKILGKTGSIRTFDTPELDRFRTKARPEYDRYVEQDSQLVSLKVPLLKLPFLDAPLSFQKKSVSIPVFEKRSLNQKAIENYDERQVEAMVQGLNYLRVLMDEGNYVEAKEALRILEVGKSHPLLPRDTALWWLMKGELHQQLSVELNDDALFERGVDFWKDGLQKVAGRGGNEQDYSSYMLLESLRILFEKEKYYAAAAMLAWSRKVRWGPETEERLNYLAAEAHYRLGMYEEAHSYFSRFVDDRKDLPNSAAYDRRLLPLAFFRLGDAQLRLGKFRDSIKDYSRAIAEMPSAEKVSVEGSWFPSELRFYPQALYHRAEASLRIGKEKEALSDLRAFIHFALDHPNAPMVMFRIGDVLESMGAEDSKIDGTWRECVFRSGEGIGNRLCSARQAAREIKTVPINRWPRLVAKVDEISEANNLDRFEESFTEDLRTYSKIVLADAFLYRDQPFQAYTQLSKVKLSTTSKNMKTWAQEYQISALGGYLQSLHKQGRYKDALDIYAKEFTDRKLELVRPEIQWPVVLSYEDLGIYTLASQHLVESMKGFDKKQPHKSRPYLPTYLEWVEARLRLSVQLYKSGEPRARDIAQYLRKASELNMDKAKLARFKVDIADAEDDVSSALKAWRELRKFGVLGWADVLHYQKLLQEQELRDEALELLESNVGAWLSVRKERRPEPAPPAFLVYRLHEERVRNKDYGPAYSAIEYLLGLSDDELNSLSRAQLLYSQGQVLVNMGRSNDARQSFESARSLAPNSLWGELSTGELGTL